MTMLFWLALVLGGGLAVFSLLGDVFGDSDAVDDVDLDHDGLHILSLRSATYFLFAFGAVGVLLDWAWGGRYTLAAFLAAAITGTGAGLFSAFVFRWIRRTDSGSMPTDRTLVGAQGWMSLPLAGGRGKVMVRRGGREYELMARPFDDSPDAESWTSVVVVDVVDGTALVSRFDESDVAAGNVLPPLSSES